MRKAESVGCWGSPGSAPKGSDRPLRVALWRSAPRGSGGGRSGDVVSGGGAQAPRPYIRILAPRSAERRRLAASRPGLPGAPWVGALTPPSPKKALGGRTITTSASSPPAPQVLGCDFFSFLSLSVFNVYLKSLTLQRQQRGA